MGELAAEQTGKAPGIFIGQLYAGQLETLLGNDGFSGQLSVLSVTCCPMVILQTGSLGGAALDGYTSDNGRPGQDNTGTGDRMNTTHSSHSRPDQCLYALRSPICKYSKVCSHRITTQTGTPH